MTLVYHSKCGPIHPLPWVRLCISLLGGTLIFLTGWDFRFSDLSATPNALLQGLIFLAIVPLSMEWFYHWHNYYAYRYFALNAPWTYLRWQYTVGYLLLIPVMIYLYLYLFPAWLGPAFPSETRLLMTICLYAALLISFGLFLMVKINSYSLKYQTSMILSEGGEHHTVNLLDIDLISQPRAERVYLRSDGKEFVNRPSESLKELADRLDPYYFFFSDQSIINRKAVNNRVFVVDEDGQDIT